MVESVRPAACWCSLYGFCVVLVRQAQYVYGVVQGGSCAGFGVFLARLSEQVEPGAVLPLRVMYSDLMCRHPGPQDARLIHIIVNPPNSPSKYLLAITDSGANVHLTKQFTKTMDPVIM